MITIHGGMAFGVALSALLWIAILFLFF